MRLHRHALALLSLGALAASGLCLLWTMSAGAAGGAKGLQAYVAVPLPRVDAAAAAQEATLAAISDSKALQEQGTQVKSARAALSSRPPRTLQVAQWQVSGHVVALDGLPLSGHSIRLGGDAPGVERTRSDAAGAFAMSIPAQSDALAAAAPGFVTVAGTRARRGEEGLIVSLPAHRYTVSVGDATTGLPLTAARITPMPSSALHTSLEAARLDLAPSAAFVSGALPSSSTARTGLAAFDELPGPQWIDALVTRPGYDDQRVSFEAAADGNLAIWLTPITGEGGWSGRVVDAEGQPLSGAWVACGSTSARTAADGLFSLPRTEPSAESADESLYLDAYHASCGAARVKLAPSPTGPIELRLPKSIESLQLRLLSRSGSGVLEPIQSARVLPLNSKGRADFLGPFWRAAQSDIDGLLDLPSAMEGTTMAAYSKGGQELGRFELRAGDMELAMAK